jgi:acetylornithine deacetylase/succinyl-diaminopimelate desuccinylase-like protein
MTELHDTLAQECVSRHADALLAFARALIAAPSPSPPGDERAVAAVAQAELQRLELGAVEVAAPRPERPNLLCRWESGRPGRTLILNGHLDTKAPGPLDLWSADPYEPVVREGQLYGLGAADMKGPCAALAYGVLAAKLAGAQTVSGTVLLALTADEEGEAQDGARYLVQDLGVRGDAALIAEPCGVTRDWEWLPLVSRGFGGARFVVHGTSVHSSVADLFPGGNASVAAAELLLHLQRRLRLRCPDGLPHRSAPTFVVGSTFTSGQGLAMVPGRAEFTVNVRTVPGMTREGVATDVETCLADFRRERPDADVEWDFVPGTLAWTTPTETSPQEPLVSAVVEAARIALGRTPPFGTFPGGTDAIWWQGLAGIPTIPAFGPGMLTQCHRPNESIAIAELTRAAAVYALTILRYLGSDDP